MLNGILQDKKKLTYAIIGIVVVIALIIATVLMINSINNANKATTTTTTTKKAQADVNKTQAIEALKDKNDTKAKQLFTEANQQYKAAGDTNNVVDTNAQLCILGEKAYCSPSATK
jgi:hypothetical protein